MANTQPKNQSSNKTQNKKKEAHTYDYSLDSMEALDHIYSSISSNSEVHKSFDFSNVAIFADNSGHIGTDDADYRHFHQMRIYIQIPEYLRKTNMELSNTSTLLLTSNLPESISYSLGSNWEKPLSFGSAATNLLMQLGGSAMGLGGSGVPRAASLRIWSGSEPLSLQLKIPVIDDGKTGSNTNLMEALEILGMLVLPTLNGSFYTPPPSPLNATITFAKDPIDHSQKGSINLNTGKVGRIMVQLGGILLIDNCVIESVSVNYPNTKAMIMHDYAGLTDVNYGNTGSKFLHPLLAEISLKISTIETTTANTYAKMLWAKPQGGSGKYNFDASNGVLGVLTGTMYAGVKNTIDMVKGVGA